MFFLFFGEREGGGVWVIRTGQLQLPERKEMVSSNNVESGSDILRNILTASSASMSARYESRGFYGFEVNFTLKARARF